MVKTFWSEVLDLVFPLQCAGCGAWDVALCERCWLLADDEPRLSSIDDLSGVPEVPVWSLGDYGGPLRQLILSAKHQPGRNLDDFLFHAGCRLGEAASVNVGHVDEPIWVVPAPSSWRRWWDGREVTGAIAAGVVEGLNVILGEGASRSVTALRLRLGTRSQSQRSKETRVHSRQSAVSVVTPPPPKTAVILVDDVCTTGATLTEIIRQLGSSVQAAAVLARA